jgi:hypothetical protein
MHFFCGLEGPTSLRYKHKSLIRPIIQHNLISNINKVVHKVIGCWGKDKSPTTQGAPIGDLNKKSCAIEESLQKKNFKNSLRKKRRRMQWKLKGLWWNLERWVLATFEWKWIHHNPLHPNFEAIVFHIRFNLFRILKSSK